MKPRTLKIMCAGLFAIMLAYDLYVVASGQTDPDRYMPFVLPAVFGAFFFLIRWIEKVDKMSPAEYAAYSSRLIWDDRPERDRAAERETRSD